ncbi:tat pathway signal sequence [Paraphaeosphaeria sporulosa]
MSAQTAMWDFLSKKNRGFKPLADKDGDDDADRESLLSLAAQPLVRRGPSWRLFALCLVATSCLSVILGAWIGNTARRDADAFSIRHTSQYSPIVDNIDIHFTTLRFNGSLLSSNPFRSDAGPEVDAAWKSLGADYSAARIPLDLAAKSGLAPDQVQIKQKYGGGYPAHVEGMHHLHCLNLLRKSLAWNFAYYQAQGLGPFSNDKEILKYHVTHCLDILRQQLMCTVDVGVLGQVWYQPEGKSPTPFVDFNTVHMCRNFEAVRAWAEEHQLPAAEDTPVDFLEPPKEGGRVWAEVP